MAERTVTNFDSSGVCCFGRDFAIVQKIVWAYKLL